MLEPWQGGPLGALLGGAVVLVLCTCNLSTDGVAATSRDETFVAPGSNLRSIAQQRHKAGERTIRSGQPAALVPDTTVLATGSALVLVALLASSRVGTSRIARRSGGIREANYNTYERKWWSIKEDRDPTTLPLWQRDWGYGYRVLFSTMMWDRKKQRRTFWDVRVLGVYKGGYQIEMLNSGLLGICPKVQEGKPLEVGDVVKMECIGTPMKRKEKRNSYPIRKKKHIDRPVFSHKNYLDQIANIEMAKDFKAGQIIECKVHKHISKGLLMELPGGGRGCGMLDMMDISRLKSSHDYVTKMFPPGTKMTCYVIHSDTSNGRITLGTKEFEDDDKVGWMLSFPERVMAQAEYGAEKYEEKRAAYIKWLQR